MRLEMSQILPPSSPEHMADNHDLHLSRLQSAVPLAEKEFQSCQTKAGCYNMISGRWDANIWLVKRISLDH